MLPEKAIDVPIGPKPVHPLPVLTRIQSQLGPIATRQSVLEHGHPVEEDGAEVKLSQGRKWALLVIFSLALFVDVVGSSAFFVFTGVVAPDLDIVFEQQSWVICKTSYTVTFSSSLLFWGRVSDLYSPSPVFKYNMFSMAALSLLLSFLPDKYSFFVFRALCGISAAALVPSAFRLIVAIFEPHELGRAFTLYGMSGALGNVLGLELAGVFSLIPGQGQMAAWRWFFRGVAVVVFPVALVCLKLVPTPKGAANESGAKWKRLDLLGAMSMLSAIVLLVLSLNFGATYGFRTPSFLVPFILAFPLLVFFFFWESRQAPGFALLPSSTWRIPNFTTLIVFALLPLGWWSVNFVPLVEIFRDVHGESNIMAATRMLPEGIAAAAVCVVMGTWTSASARPRWPVVGAMLSCIVAYVLWIKSGTQVGADYWRFIFPGMIIGSAGMQVVLTGVNVAVMTAVPPSQAGVAGATLQSAYQVGAAIALSIQAGLMTVHEGGVENFANVQASWYFELGWTVCWLILFLVFYRPGRRAKGGGADPEMVVV